MKILVINAGSSSIKYQLFDMPMGQPLAKGLVDRIGQSQSRLQHTRLVADDAQETVKAVTVADHRHGLAEVARLLMDEAVGVIREPAEIAAVGHRVVHGGERFSQTTQVDAQVKAEIEALIPLAPLHNPANLQGIAVAEEIFPQATQVAVFDTAFHQTMPPTAYRYALPSHLYEEYGVRAYGFHGTSHRYVSQAAADYLGKPLHDLNLITAHLGNGCSITAVKGGQSVDTSMGLTPLAGLAMGTRSGDVDPGLLLFLSQKLGLSVAEIDTLLNKQSGLLGLAGDSDVRDLQARQAAGDTAAHLALEVYAYRIKKYIGAYLAILGPVEAIVFTAGVGENSADVRQRVCEGLAHVGILFDEARNARQADGIVEFQAAGSPIKLLVVPTNEELEIAKQTLAVVAESR